MSGEKTKREDSHTRFECPCAEMMEKMMAQGKEFDCAQMMSRMMAMCHKGQAQSSESATSDGKKTS